MEGIAGALVVGFVIGLSGALAPGPTLLAAISASARCGWTAGPRVTAGHALIEAGIFVLIVGGLAAVLRQYQSAIAVVGGVALIGFGLLTVRESRAVAILEGDQGGMMENPYLAGMLTSAANPYFWMWWVTIGSVLLLDGLRGGFIVAASFIIGHWSADLGWYTLISTSIHRGRSILS
ncbi:MAG: LysE family transporter, partial [Methanomicrobiaceae archaeon]|nr:LysE family transporter [Methanomicrobiaceae archaeon]